MTWVHMCKVVYVSFHCSRGSGGHASVLEAANLSITPIPSLPVATTMESLCWLLCGMDTPCKAHRLPFLGLCGPVALYRATDCQYIASGAAWDWANRVRTSP